MHVCWYNTKWNVYLKMKQVVLRWNWNIYAISPVHFPLIIFLFLCAQLSLNPSTTDLVQRIVNSLSSDEDGPSEELLAELTPEAFAKIELELIKTALASSNEKVRTQSIFVLVWVEYVFDCIECSWDVCGCVGNG